jgi:hypothetical protein
MENEDLLKLGCLLLNKMPTRENSDNENDLLSSESELPPLRNGLKYVCI